MNHKISSLLRGFLNMSERDVFTRTRGRLTRIYSGLLILFLTLFILIVYAVLHVTILKNQEHELQTLVSQEANFIEKNFLKNNSDGLHDVQNQEVIFSGVNQYFYYVVSSNGEFVMGNEADHRLRPELLSLVKSLNPTGMEIRKETLRIQEGLHGKGIRGEFHPREEAQDLQLMIAGQPLYNNGQYIGKLFVGKDISFTYKLFHWILIILVILGGVFFGGALWISVLMSKRAMVPISGAFARQREFVADASHELRNPLSVLLSSIDAIEMTMEPNKEEMSGRFLTNMRQEVKRMTRLVSDLLTLARSDSNKIELKAELFDFRLFADKAIESVQPLAASKEITLTLTAPETLKVVGDSERLSQLLYILLDNAIKYTPNGGDVKLTISEEVNTLGLEVEDTGIGIKQVDYQRIFERFYRSDKSRSRQMSGHGLGLSIAKWIVETHNGTIKVSSEIGKGSKFTIRVPKIR
ncbi:sensor histidine kinase [Bacillus salipaludis]|uniref:histidine kinase n=1 Tax=Bacillus salipaludis TaxID=2547811 RepID=A0AA90R5U0_9BACI|nr:ATP-binding protein [Bacillus salipaludis]MDQ6595746.1 ATP-binding protein [Bacillus salipaludis]